MNKTLTYLAQFKKALAAIVAAVVSAGGVAVLFPNLSGTLATTLAGVVSVLAVVLAPKNKDPEPPVV